MKFKYTQSFATNSKGHFVSRPLLELDLLGPANSLSVFGLVDSGADMSLLNIRYAEALGITLDGLPTKDFIGISDVPVPTHFTEVPIKVKYFNDVLCLPVAFADSPSIDVLLGQEGFFDAYRIRFERDHDVFELQASRAYWSRELSGNGTPRLVAHGRKMDREADLVELSDPRTGDTSLHIAVHIERLQT